jgi:hypothetical protein
MPVETHGGVQDDTPCVSEDVAGSGRRRALKGTLHDFMLKLTSILATSTPQDAALVAGFREHLGDAPA